ncbi:MAG TPA: septum formation initiator family protein [Thermoanaerobaculia bacterium]|nr:septum formation initiator family protein [Thermoanaerobaculia bacterium]
MTAPVSTHDSRRATQVTLKAVILLSGVLTLVFLVSFFFSDRGIAELQHARRRVDDLHTDIQRLQTENARLRGEIDSAKKSTWAVERIAREDLGMSKKGEVVYMLPAKQTTTASR